MKRIILLEFKRTSDASESIRSETYYTDMKKTADTKRTPILTGLNDLVRDRCWEVEVLPLVAGQRLVKEKEWLESLQIFGDNTVGSVMDSGIGYQL